MPITNLNNLHLTAAELSAAESALTQNDVSRYPGHVRRRKKGERMNGKTEKSISARR
jgi:hypothetical protein